MVEVLEGVGVRRERVPGSLGPPLSIFFTADQRRPQDPSLLVYRVVYR